MTAGVEEQRIAETGTAAAEPRSARLTRGLSRLTRIFRLHAFSSLTRRIIVLNLAALVVLVSGILYLNQFRAGLIDARVSSLMTQGEIIAGAIAASATVDTDAITIDPEKLLDLQAGESASPLDHSFDSLEFAINPERVAPILRRLISPTRTRARIYDRDGSLIVDSQPPLLARPDSPLRPAAARRRHALVPRSHLAGRPGVAAERRPADLQGTRRRQRQGLSRRSASRSTACRTRSCASPTAAS